MNQQHPQSLKVGMLLLTVVLMCFFVGCGGSRTSQNTKDNDSLQALHNDTLVWLAKKSLNQDVVFTLLDSLERVKAIGPVRANYERAAICKMIGQQQQSEKYFRASVNSEIKGRREEKAYYKSVYYLTNLLQTKHDFEGALRVAVHNIAAMKRSKEVQPTDIGILLGDIGICQLKTSRDAEADKSFEDSYRYFKKVIDSDTVRIDIENVIIISCNTVLFCLDAQKYDAAMKWVNRIDTMLQVYKAHPYADASVYDLQVARSLNARARILLAQGHPKEAEEMFQKYQQSNSYKTGRYRASGEYLMAAKRYKQAVECYADIENDIHRHLARPNLDVIQQYLFPKYRANAGAGYKDSTVAIGLRILMALDSAIAWQKQDEAAELATIYETQEKDREIAEQKASISQQRLVTTYVIAALVVLALAVFIFFRHKAAVRLENEHKKLVKAYDQLEETTTAKERIESELRIARDIQMSMVPHVFPQREGLDMYASMSPAREVGGDLYGYLLEDDKLYFAVGDVSGKGIPASLFMAQTTRLFQTLAKQGMMPAEICTRMNDALSGDDNESGMFVTFFLGLVDLQTGHLDFCNAGHNPPVIGGGTSRGDFLDMIPNAPIGLWAGLEYQGETIDTIKGRPLFIYTDGLNEAENPQQEQYGEERLIDILRKTRFDSARQVIETLYAEVERHRHGAEPNDDLTMLCLKIQ
jgi:serine phosphatase RsbU (regulator of sigma subunit)